MSEIKDILRSHRTELEAQGAVLVVAGRPLGNAIHAGQPSANEIRAAAAAVGTAESTLGVTRRKIVTEVPPS